MNIRKEILNMLDNEEQGFISPEWSEFNKFNLHDLHKELFNLVDEGILRKRNCLGLAFKYAK